MGVCQWQRRPITLRRAQSILPPRLRLANLGRHRLQLLLQAIDLGLCLFPGRLLFDRGQVECGFEEPRPVPVGATLVVGVGKEREQPEIVLLAERIVLVVVALGAGERGAKPDRRRRVDAIDEHFVHRLVRIDAPFLVRHRIAMEAGRDPLIDGRIWQHVAGNLLDSELVERHVSVERVDHPVAVLPDAAPIVFFVAIGVGVSGEVQPGPRPTLAVVRRGEQAIDDALVGVGLAVGKERVELGNGRGKARQVQREPTKERRLGCFRRGRHVFALEACQHEPIDPVTRPRRLIDPWQFGPARFDVHDQCSGSAVGSVERSATPVPVRPVAAASGDVAVSAPGMSAP